jgi:hypothetical protein
MIAISQRRAISCVVNALGVSPTDGVSATGGATIENGSALGAANSGRSDEGHLVIPTQYVTTMATINAIVFFTIFLSTGMVAPVSHSFVGRIVAAHFLRFEFNPDPVPQVKRAYSVSKVDCT